RLGVRVRVIDKAPAPGLASRAIVVQARTLEQYRQLGIAGEVAEAGLPVRGLDLWVTGERRGRVRFGDIGEGQSPVPYLLTYPQDAHEALLIRHLARLGVPVERPCEAIELEAVGDRVRVRVSGGEDHDAAYVCGCDGARSFVREALGVGFPGGTYAHLFYV